MGVSSIYRTPFVNHLPKPYTVTSRKSDTEYDPGRRVALVCLWSSTVVRRKGCQKRCQISATSGLNRGQPGDADGLLPPSGCGDNHENQDRALRERVAAPAAGDR